MTKLQDIKRGIAIINYDIVVIETWLTGDISSNEILPTPDTYKIFRTDRENTQNPLSRREGVFIAVNKRFGAEALQSVDQHFIETQAITLTFESVPLFNLIAICSPSYQKQTQSTELVNIIQKVKTISTIDKTILLGDLNCAAIQWEHDCSRNSLTNELLPILNETCIDLVFINKVAGFVQKNGIPNDQHIFLDLIFADYDIQSTIRKAENIELLDRVSKHHQTYIMSIPINHSL